MKVRVRSIMTHARPQLRRFLVYWQGAESHGSFAHPQRLFRDAMLPRVVTKDEVPSIVRTDAANDDGRVSSQSIRQYGRSPNHTLSPIFSASQSTGSPP